MEPVPPWRCRPSCKVWVSGVRSQPRFTCLAAVPFVCWGSPCQTLDLDYTAEIAPEAAARIPARYLLTWRPRSTLIWKRFRSTSLSPLPSNGIERRRLIGRFGASHRLHFSTRTRSRSARSRRGFESDLEDVLFMIQTGVDSVCSSWSSISRRYCRGPPSSISIQETSGPILRKFAVR